MPDVGTGLFGGVGRHGRRAVVASAIGTTIEWYDFYLYSTASAILIGPLFFPKQSAAAAALASFATYAAGFVARPLGGAVIGHFGDRIGRKSMLVLTLLVMGISTFLVGILPTYAQAGVWAPVLLVTLRVLQGIGIGGEWGGGVLLTAEHGGPRRRAIFSSFPAAGFPLGLAASTAVFSLVTRLPHDALFSWGWRLPFMASIVLVAIGVVVRLGVAETPEFLNDPGDGGSPRLPIGEVLRQRPYAVICGVFAAMGLAMTVSIYTVYLLAHASSGPVGRPRVLTGLMLGALLEVVLLPVFGTLSDRWGRRRTIILGYAVCALVAVPGAGWLTSGRAGLVDLTFLLALGVGHAAVYGGFAAFLVDLFPTRQRYSALAVTYQLGATVASFGPLAAAALEGSRGSVAPGVAILLGTLIVAAAAVIVTPRSGASR